MSKGKEKRKSKGKEKPERKEIHACEKYAKKNQMCIKEKRKKGILKSFR
jgi:hypothetical protein